MAVCPDNQIFDDTVVAMGPEPASHGPRVREGGPSAEIFGIPLHPPLPQDSHDPQRGVAGESQADATLIPSDDEVDLDGRSGTSFELPLPDARNVIGKGMCVDLAFLGRPRS
jgi:hypothetical protein